jgi:hypothetical protein
MLAIVPSAARAASVCGPSGTKTLAKSAEARVYLQKGSVRSCHRARKGAYRLGARAKIIDVKVAGRYASVRKRIAEGQSLRVFDLRRARPVVKPWRGRRIGLTKLDPSGVAVFHAIRSDGHGVVALTTDGLSGLTSGVYGFPPRVDDIGLKGEVVGYRVGNVVKLFVATALTSASRAAQDGTLLTFGGARLDVTRRALRYRGPGGSAFAIGGYPSTYDCDTPEACRGWDTFHLYDNRVVVVDNDFNTDVTAYDSHTGARTVLCPGLVMAYVVTDTGKVACGQFHGGDPVPSDIVSEGVVIDTGSGISPGSLTRRGDQLVWLNDGVERTAPIPR